MESTAFEKIQDVYFTLDKNFNALFAACGTDAQKDQLRMDYVKARDVFWEARSRVFSENDPMIKQTSTKLTKAKKQIDANLASLQLTVNTLKLITAVVNFASSLTTFA